MPRKIPSVDRRILTYDVTVTNKGQPVVLDSVRAAVLPIGVRPTRDTEWTLVPVVDGEANVTVAGEDADPGEGIVLPRGSYWLRLRASDNPESISAVVDTIEIT